MWIESAASGNVMERLAPIPASWSSRLELFRRQVVPAVAFVLVAIGVVLFWDSAAPGPVTGVAEGTHSLVSAPQNAHLQALWVEPFTVVQAGQPLAVLVPSDPRSAFDLWQAELTWSRLQTEPSLAEANAMDFERFRTELLRLQSEIEVARVNLKQAERQVERYAPLRQEDLLSEDLFELSRTTRDALRAEVETKERMAELLRGRAEALQSLGVPGTAPGSARTDLLQRLEQLRADARTNLAPITLYAPRSGLVQSVFRQAGEHLVVGEPIIQISAFKADRIVGYLRQPYPLQPAPGLRVEVSTREVPRRTFLSEIAQVGARLEVITNALAFVRPNALVDSGLPFVVRLPVDLDLRPGEVVDLRIHPPANPSLPASQGGSFWRAISQRTP